MRRDFLSLCFLFLLLSFSASASAAEQKDAPVEERKFQERMDFANGLYARDMYQLAVSEYDSLVRDFPDHPQIYLARYRSIESLFFDRQYAAVISRARDFAARFGHVPEAGTAKTRIGESLYHLGRLGESMEEFQALFENPSAQVRQTARYFSGKIFFDQSSLDAARVHFTAVLESSDGSPFRTFAQYYLGEIALLQNQAGDAVPFYQKAAESGRPELVWISKFGLGKSYLALSRYEEAKLFFEEILEAAPDPVLTEDAFVNYLQALYQLGQHGALVEKALKNAAVIRTDRKRQSVRFLLASSYAKVRQFEEAVRIYEEIVSSPEATEEDIITAKQKKVELMMDAGDLQGALEHLEAMTEERTDRPEPFLILKADTLARMGKREEALKELDAVIENFPASDFLAEAVLKKGYLLIEMGRNSEARGILRVFFDEFRTHALAPKVLYDVILLDTKLEMKEKAVEDSELFLQFSPGNALAEKVHFRLGSLYTDLKQYEAAHKTYSDHLTRFPDAEKRHEIHFLMGYNKQLAGDFVKAVEYYSRVEPGRVERDVYYSMLKSRAYCHIVLENYEAAARDYDIIVTGFTQNDLSADVYFWLTDYYITKEEPARARRVLELFGARQEAVRHKAEMAYFTAESFRAEGKTSEAMEHYDRCIAEQGDFLGDAYFGKGLVFRSLGDLIAAEEGFSLALDSAHDDHELSVRSRTALAELKFSQENYLEAAKGYLAIGILYDDPDHVPPALMKAAQAFEKGNFREDARRVLKELVDRYQNHPLAAEAKKKLETKIR